MRLEGRTGLLAALLISGLSLAAALSSVVAHDMVLGFSDAPSHLLSARRVYDNLDPSLSQLGTHWTPLFHVLQLPLIWLTPLYESGASGIAVSAAATLLTVASTYRLARLVGAEPWIAVAAVGALSAQPAFALSGAMPMLPALVMATVTTNVYYLTRWAMHGHGLDLLLSATWLTLAVLAHFETWVLLPLELAVVWATARARWAVPAKTEATLLLWAPLAGFGVLFFLYMNVSIYGSPIAFVRPFAGTGDVIGSAHHGASALLDHPRAVAAVAGWPLLVVGAIGLCWYVWRLRKTPGALVPLLLLAPLAWFALQAVTTGSIIEPAAEAGGWRNLRYGVTILPGLAFFGVIGPRPRSVAVACALLAIAAGAAKAATGHDGLWLDAKADAPHAPLLQSAARVLADHRDASRILLFPHGPEVDRLELYGNRRGIPLDRFVDANDQPWASIARTRRVPAPLRVGWLVSIRDPTLKLSAAERRPLPGFTLCRRMRGRTGDPFTVEIYRRTPQRCSDS